MTDQKIFIAGYFPDEESEKAGIKRVATAFNAKDIERAKAKANFIFLEEYEHAQDAAFKILVCEDTPDVAGRPSRGTWNEEFLYEYDWPEDVGHPVKRQAEKVNFDKLSTITKIAVLVKYDSTEITKADLPAALELTQDEANTFEGHVVEAISKMPEIANMYPERIQHVIGWVGAKCDHSAKWPEIQKEIAAWQKRQDGERKQTGSSKSLVDIARETAAAEKLRKQNQAPVHLQDEESLKRNIALGLVAKAMDFDILNPPASIVNRAREIIKLKEKPFPAWFAAMSATLGIYEYSTVQIIYSVKISPEDIDKTAGSIQAHINRTFTETEHANPSAEMLAIACGTSKTEEGKSNETEQNQTGTTGPLDDAASTAGAVEPEHNADGSAAGPLETAPQIERTGPFYFLLADGEKVGRANKLPGLDKTLADGGKEISQEEYLARKNGTYEAPAAPADNSGTSNKPEVTNHGAGRFSIDGLMSEQQPSGSTPAISSEDSEEQAAASVAPVAGNEKPEFTLRADELEKELGDSDNISLWKGVMRTNPRYTKDMGDLGFGGTAINAEYMIMRATEKFGPVGIGWGWQILEDKMIEGAPLTEKIFEGTKFVGKRILRDADGSLMFELNHYIRIGLWYIKDGKKGIVENFGSTPYRQTTKNGIFCDSEVHKKSLTDAIKKCLSGLGFCADVWLGLYDDAAYKAESVIEFGLKDATEKAEDSTRIREELDERFKQNVETMRNAVSQNEVSKIASSLTRAVSIHLKAAKDINDNEYVKYLEGRLRRLEDIKGECLSKLEEKA
ncbi:exodeoxyribonuclease VIII [Enterobacter kobei]|uniref:exodeoxyribonuclease VIII n=1 Tax=Enterobacter kobei TaxID=208224 RepID=UPI001A124F2A|nr:exodeoxyribonuclease VIII [Enterobacter kobei]EKY1591267.1 exodeoxyribonuclease VIII [Enterobacter kobei]MCK7182659.1 exodeoxyribonuclease VIII [Enterobacter kobei]